MIARTKYLRSVYLYVSMFVFCCFLPIFSRILNLSMFKIWTKLSIQFTVEWTSYVILKVLLSESIKAEEKTLKVQVPCC